MSTNVKKNASEPTGPSVQKYPSILKVGFFAVAASIIANLILRAIAFAVWDLPTEFPPLQPVAIAAFTLGGTVLATWVYAFIRKRAKKPESLFRWIALVALIVSIIPNFLLMSNPTLTPFPGGSSTTFGVLILFHVVAALVSVSILTSLGRPGTSEEVK